MKIPYRKSSQIEHKNRTPLLLVLDDKCWMTMKADFVAVLAGTPKSVPKRVFQIIN